MYSSNSSSEFEILKFPIFVCINVGSSWKILIYSLNVDPSLEKIPGSNPTLKGYQRPYNPTLCTGGI